MADDDRNDAKSEDTGTQAQEAPDAELERTRKLILERRNRFMAAALAGIGVACSAACSRTRSSVCLSFAAGSGAIGEIGGGTAINEPCPGQPWRTQPPCVCLSLPVVDAGPVPFGGAIGLPNGGTIAPPVAGTVATPTAGRPGNGGTGGAGGAVVTPPMRPGVCLSPPRDEDAGT